MSYTQFECVRRTARRKEHTCIWCGKPIRIGDEYHDERGVYDGNIQRQRWHPNCLLFAQEECFSQGEEEFDPWDNLPPTQEWLDKYAARAVLSALGAKGGK